MMNQKKTQTNEMDIENEMASAFISASTENNILRARNKHLLRAGMVSIEIVPTAETSVEEVVNAFSKVLKELHEMHGDEHLKVQICSDIDEGTPKSLAGEMFS